MTPLCTRAAGVFGGATMFSAACSLLALLLLKGARH